MSISKQLWQSNQDIVKNCFTHPFIKGIAQGNLDRLYAFLGQQLAKDGIPEHQYADWIRTYSSQEFEQLAQQLESLGDRYVKTKEVVQSTYRYALLCEQDFFDAAWDAIAIN
jgi:thiaminase/transcriptional activator TenA